MIDIPMPKSCCECGQFRWDISLQGDVCRIAEALGGGGIFQSENEGIGSRPSWCPLVAVPKHGRLIDGDELEEQAWRLDLSTRQKIADMIKYAPTIIK